MTQSNICNKAIIIICLVIFFIGCKDDEPIQDCITNPVNFIGLTAEHDTIETGGSTIITATAEGYTLSYEWTASKGFIFPGESDNTVTYTASPCAIGEITITCKASDACDNSETKNIIIVVL